MIVEEIYCGTNLIFKSGKKIMPSFGVIGIGQDLVLSDGYDSGHNWPVSGLTKEEKIELAEHFIELWNLKLMEFKLL